MGNEGGGIYLRSDIARRLWILLGNELRELRDEERKRIANNEA